MNKRHLLLGYVVLVHIALALAILKSDTVTHARFLLFGNGSTARDFFVATTTSFQLRVDANVDADAVLFFGDSHVHGLCVSCVSPRGVNFGIGSETASELLQRIPRYRSLKTAHSVILATGYNDMKRLSVADAAAIYKQLLQIIPETTDLIVSALFPIDSAVANSGRVSNAMVSEINRQIRDLCDLRPRCTFVDITRRLADERGELRKTLHIGDGVHLNPDGYAIWITGLKAALND